MGVVAAAVLASVVAVRLTAVVPSSRRGRSEFVAVFPITCETRYTGVVSNAFSRLAHYLPSCDG